jgi:multidrug efflux pump subunit AcrB
MGVKERAEAIRQIVIRAGQAGSALRVRDIATVHEGFVDEQIITRFDGASSAQITVIKVGDQDIVQMAEMVRAYVAGRMDRPFPGHMFDHMLQTPLAQAYDRGTSNPLPPGISVATHSDLARFVEGRLELLTRNAAYGAMLVFATLLVFLNWRVAFWVGIGLVTALAGTLVLMRVTDISLNLLTMFGLIVVLGILVDDAIVVAENVQSWHDRGEPSLVAAIRGTEQVFWPVVATVLTSIVAFLPLTWVRGRIGDMLGALPAVVACALLMSLIESLLILPSHMGHSRRHRDRKQPRRLAAQLLRFETWRDDLILNKIVPAYSRLLAWALRERYVTLTAAVAVLIGSMGLYAGKRLDFVFLPSDDTETIIASVRMPLGSSIERTADIVEQLELAAREQTETRSVSTVIGQRTDLDTGAIDATATHLAEMFIELMPVEDRESTSATRRSPADPADPTSPSAPAAPTSSTWRRRSRRSRSSWRGSRVSSRSSTTTRSASGSCRSRSSRGLRRSGSPSPTWHSRFAVRCTDSTRTSSRITGKTSTSGCGSTRPRGGACMRSRTCGSSVRRAHACRCRRSRSSSTARATRRSSGSIASGRSPSRPRPHPACRRRPSPRSFARTRCRCCSRSTRRW